MNALLKMLVIALAVSLFGCAQVERLHTAKETANALADQALYQPIEYANKHKPGPALIVLPGEIKSANATFTQKFSSNNIADYGELELGNANFKVYERSDLGPLLDEISLAANMGDPDKVRKILKRGKFKTTQWFVRFDILKAEQVAQAETGADLSTIGNIIGMAAGGVGGYAAGTAVGSVETAQTAGVWIIGLRYKVIDANTTEQVATGYFEDKMEVGKQATSILGFRQGQMQQVTLDSMVQRLIQKAVADLDKKK